MYSFILIICLSFLCVICNNVIITGCVLLREIAFNKFPLLLLLLLSIYFNFYCFFNIINISLCIMLIMVFLMIKSISVRIWKVIY